MKNVLNLLVLLIIQSCNNVPYPPPRTEVCISNGDTTAQCDDIREVPRNYLRNDIMNYICTNPKDYDRLYLYCANLRKELINCRYER
jgi:hypothetical protein